MTTLISLSDEVIDIILSYNDISFEDIINFRCVCKKFRWAAKMEEYCFLKRKFYQRWSSAKKYYDQQSKENKQKQSEENEQQNAIPINFIETGIDYAKQLRNYVSKKMSVLISNSTKEVLLRESLEEQLDEEYLSEEDLSKLMFSNNNYIKILLFMDEIKQLLDQPVRANCDLTDKYCYIKLFDALRMGWRKDILNRYIEEQPYKEQPYEELSEESAITWAQQLQLGKYISYSSVKASLKSMALEALNLLRDKHPEHSIFSTPDKYFSHWENNNIEDNHWSETEGTQIMDTLQIYMFDKLKFRPIFSRKLEYECIDYVLKNKHGNDIILYIIYKSVARRLGLRCDLVQAPHDYFFELLWMPKYTFPTHYKENICLLYTDRKKGMKSFQLNYCDYPNGIIMRYIFRSQGLYIKTSTEMLESIMSKRFPFNYWDKCLINHLKKCVFKIRPKNIKFAVGMIVTHGDDSEDCSNGVIIGWLESHGDLTCEINTISFLITPLRVCSYLSAEQIYCIVLTKSDKLCFVREDDIALTRPKWIENRNIYHYFSKFEGTHYVPNEKLAEVYPYDADIAAATIFKS